MSVSPTSPQVSSSPSLAFSSSPRSTSTSGGNTNTMSTNSALLFGFLVSALSLFGVLMMSGLIWHRLVMRRRMIDDMLRVDGPLHRRELRRPQLWDVLALPGHGCSRWKDTQPLAAEKHCVLSPPSPQHSQVTRRSFWKRLIDRAPREITYLFFPPDIAQVAESPLSNHSRSALPVDNSHVQVSVLIAMPRSPDSLSISSKDIGLGKDGLSYEMVIGSTNTLYHDSDSDSQ